MHRDQSRKNAMRESLVVIVQNQPNFFSRSRENEKPELMLHLEKESPKHSERIRLGQTLLILAIFTLAVGAYPLPFAPVRTVLFAIAAALALTGAWHIDRANIAAKQREQLS